MRFDPLLVHGARTVEEETTTMPLPTHRTTASVLRIRRTRPARRKAAPARLNGSGKAAHDHRSTGLGWHPTPRSLPLPHPNELSRELGWVQRVEGGQFLERQTCAAKQCSRLDQIFRMGLRAGICGTRKATNVVFPKRLTDLRQKANRWWYIGLVFLMCITNQRSTGQTADTLEYIMSMQYGIARAAVCKAPEAQELFRSIGIVRKSWLDQGRLNGKASFATNNEFQPGNDFFKMNGAVELSRGSYPSEFWVKAGIGVTLQNGTFQENISDLTISYDYHPYRTNSEDLPEYCSRTKAAGVKPLNLENYAYITRFSDNFMRIEQRYEIGLGTVFAGWSSVLTKSADETVKAHGQIKDFCCRLGTPEAMCMDQLAKTSRNPRLGKKGMAILQAANDRAMATAHKANAKWRYGILMGLMGELEKTGQFTDSLWSDTTLAAFTMGGMSDMRLRYTLRPFVDWRPTSRTNLKLRPYFIMPAPWDWMNTVDRKDVFGENVLEERVDWRADIQFELQVKLTTLDDVSNKEVTASVKYRLWYDNAPNRRAVDVFDERGIQQLVVLPAVHNQLLFELGITL